MLLEPRKNVGEIEDGAVGGADRMAERLERDRAEVERKALEGCVSDIGLGNARSGAGRVCIFGSPLRVGDLWMGMTHVSLQLR